MAPISVKIKCSNESAFSIDIEPSSTVLDLKQAIEKHFESSTETPASSQRLIFAGKVLKDDDTLESCKLAEGNTVHLVRGNKPSAPKTAPAPTPAPATTTPAAAPGFIPPANPFQMFGQAPPLGQSPFGQMPRMPGMPGLPPGVDPAALMNDPMFAQMMSQMMSDPNTLDQMIASNPQLASMMTPEIRQRMLSPEFRQMMSNPQMMQQMMQMAGGMGGMGAGMNPMANMYGQMPPLGANPFGQFGATPAPATAANPAVPPEELYRTQLAQLQEMGFYSQQENVRALQMTGGNVEAAVEWLFSRPPGQL